MLDVLLSWLGTNLGKTYTVLSVILPVLITSTWITLFALQHHFTKTTSKHKTS